MTNDQKLQKIIEQGGSIFMHPHDLERLKEAAASGNKPSIFNDVKVCADKTGLVQEGRPIAAVMGKVGFKTFRNTFTV